MSCQTCRVILRWPMALGKKETMEESLRNGQDGCKGIINHLSADILQAGLTPAFWVKHSSRVYQQIQVTKLFTDNLGCLLDLLCVGDIHLQHSQLLRMLLLQGMQRWSRSWVAASCDHRRAWRFCQQGTAETKANPTTGPLDEAYRWCHGWVSAMTAGQWCRGTAYDRLPSWGHSFQHHFSSSILIMFM